MEDCGEGSRQLRSVQEATLNQTRLLFSVNLANMFPLLKMPQSVHELSLSRYSRFFPVSQVSVNICKYVSFCFVAYSKMSLVHFQPGFTIIYEK